jgi:DNA-binding NarL/FixJ family response regulator
MENNIDPIKRQPNEPEKPVIHTQLANIKVVVQDYHGLYLGGIATVLRSAGFNVIGQVSGVMQLMKILSANNNIDIVIINYKVTKPITLNLAKVVKRNYPYLKIVLNTQYVTTLLFYEMMKIGIEGYFVKGIEDKDEIKNKLLSIYNS